MKTFALAAAVAAGLFCTSGSADAQYRYRNSMPAGSIYSNPTYSNPTYVYPSSGYSSFYAPSYNGVVGVGSYAPLGGTVIPTGGTSYYTPTYGYPAYSYPAYSYPTYGGSYSNGGYGRGRGWRW